MEKPKVRYLRVEPFNDGYILLDPYEISKEIFVNRYGLLMLSFMDGTRSVDEIKLDFIRSTGLLVTSDEVQSFVNMLKENLMLEDENFKKALEIKKKHILKDNVRKPSHINVCYPSDSKECKNFLMGEEKEEKLSPIGIMCPHMDLRVAKDTYWEAYGRLKDEKDLVIILGVSHYMHSMPLSVFPGHFETPFGVLETDLNLLEKLRNLYSFDITYDVLAYEKEHSIEFQTLYVKLLYPKAKVLAMIVSYGDKAFLKDSADKLLRALKGREEKALFISSIDLSHVGKRFGDRQSYDTSHRDLEYLNLLSRMQGEDAFDLLESDGNSTRIDGQFTNLFFHYLLEGLGAKEGKILDYRFHHDLEWDSRVSYASVAFV